MNKKDEGGEVDQQMVRTLAHPLRIEIPRELEGGQSQPMRLSDRVSDMPGSVSHSGRADTRFLT
jgi:hypothetical protein